MLIQCHSCNTKYRLNLEQIPRRKTFVRCKNCGTPIYIDPTEEEPTLSGSGTPGGGLETSPVTPGPSGAESAPLQHLVQVVCPSCDARYRVAPEPLQRAGVKLKCTQCGHLFAPPQHMQPPAAGVVPAAGAEPARGPAPEMPLPDEQRISHLFDDLRPGPQPKPPQAPPPAAPAPGEPELGSLTGARFEDDGPIPDAEQAYLDAVAFDAQAAGRGAASGVPEAQKFRFFLNPKDFQGSDKGMADQPDERSAGAMPEPTGEGQDAAVPPLDAAELPPLPTVQAAQSRDEMARIREVVAEQQASAFTEKRVLGIVAAAAVVILVGTGAWGYWLSATGGDRRPFSIAMGQPHQLAMQDDLHGRYVANKPSGRRLFVVNGQIDNRFDAKEQVRWIRIKGVAYADAAQSKALDTSFAYAGNVLEDGQLAEWELGAIRAYYGFTNGRKALNLSIAPGASVPYQLVFSEVEGQVGRTVAQVVSYHLNGRAIFVDNP